jgi:hypothetical protein
MYLKLRAQHEKFWAAAELPSWLTWAIVLPFVALFAVIIHSGIEARSAKESEIRQREELLLAQVQSLSAQVEELRGLNAQVAVIRDKLKLIGILDLDLEKVPEEEIPPITSANDE